MLGDVLVEQPQRVRKPLPGQHVEPAVLVPASEMAGCLSATVEHEHVGVVVRSGQPGRRCVRDVVRHEPDVRRVKSRQRGGEEARSPARVGLPQVVPGVVQPELLGRLCEVGREVSAMPPWSMPTSTSTEPGRIAASVRRSISLGDICPGVSTPAIIRSALIRRARSMPAW